MLGRLGDTELIQWATEIKVRQNVVRADAG